MGIPGGANLLLAAGGVPTYEIDQSLRFNPADDTTLTVHSGWSSQRSWTWSCWVKVSKISGEQYIWLSRGTNCGLSLTSTNELRTIFNDSGVGTGVYLRDPSAWYHIVVKAEDYSSSSPGYSDIYVYLNGELVQTRAAQARGYFTFSNQTVYIGRYGDYTPALAEWDGYMAEIHMTDGTAYDPTDFGEYDNNGVWRPIEVTGLNYGTNGFYHTFDPSATNGIGHDHSGNGNNSTPYGFTTSGTGTDVMSDTPTNNFATINPLANISGLSGTISSITKGNLKLTSNGNTTLPTTIAIPAGVGKWYWEATVNTLQASSNWIWGLQKADINPADYTNWSYVRVRGVYLNTTGGSGNQTWIYGSNSYTASSWTVSAGDVLGFALNAATGDFYYYLNGTLKDTFSATVDTSLRHYPAGSGYATSDVATWNFGQTAFSYTPPSGYESLSTANLPAPDIADGSDYFNTVLYTGNSNSTQAITGVGFQPDFTWIKNRDSATDHLLFDAVRGVTKVLKTVGTGAEETDANAFQSFNSDGFTLGTSTNGNPTKANGSAYVAWNWDAGGSGSSNTAGSITSTVSANPSAGFSIVAYTSQSTAPQTVGHGLGVKPSMIITKNRDTSSISWGVYHASLGATKTILLDSYGSSITSSDFYNNTEPTSTVFTVNVDNVAHQDGSSDKYIAYCFAEVEGYSKFGSYTGNGSLDGPFVYCGFRPAWVMIKRTDSSGEWFMVDTSRNSYNPADDDLFANYNFAETASSGKDLLSNGFKIRESGASMNGSGGSFIFMAFAENPFGGDGVSPATAR